MKNILVVEEHSQVLDWATDVAMHVCTSSHRNDGGGVEVLDVCGYDEMMDHVFVLCSVAHDGEGRHTVGSSTLVVVCVDVKKRSAATSRGNEDTPGQVVVWMVDVFSGISENDVIAGSSPSTATMCVSPVHDALCVGIGYPFGQIVTISNVKDTVSNTQRVDEVGMVEGGVAGMVWSPDGEMVVVVGGYGQCLLMTADWDVLMESQVYSIDCSDPQPTASPEEDVMELLGRLSSVGEEQRKVLLRQQDVSISWRGDCKYFSTVVRIDENAPGRIRVWDVEGQVLHAIGEQSPCALPVVAWQPNGRVMCVANYFPSEDDVDSVGLLRQMTSAEGAQGQAPEVRHVGAWKRELRRREEAAKRMGDVTGPSRVFLYERNGLQHGEFIIPGNSTSQRIEYMEWSSDSKTLAVVLRDTDVSAYSVQVWCRSNWKWYNKFTRSFDGVSSVKVLWQDTMDGTFLCMLTSAGVVSRVRFTWEYNSSIYGTVVVVDGALLRVTPMQRCMIPPPMCAVEIGCGKPVTCVACTLSGENEVIGALLADGHVAYIICGDTDDWESMAEEGEDQDDVSPVTVLKPKVTEPLMGHGEYQYRHIAWLNHQEIILIGQSLADGRDELFQYGIDLETGAITFQNAVEICGHVVRMTSTEGSEQVVVELDDGSCLVYSSDTKILVPVTGFGSCCDVIASVASESFGHAIIGLSPQGILYVDGKTVASDATSFGVHHFSAGGPHLLYTLRSNFIRTLPLNTVVGSAQVVKAVNPADVSVRAIEDGAVIVSCPKSSTDVILQAPRGNLEIIRPRALVLPAVVQALDKGSYAKAWNLATINRLDLNILADYQWPSIVTNISVFMKSIGSDTEMAGFLQALTPQSVLGKGGLYSSVIDCPSDTAESGKVDLICCAVRDYISGLEDDSDRRHWLCTELTSHTKCGRIGKALLRVKEVKEADLNIIDSKGLERAPKISAESGLKHILLHNVENDVYNAALGEYELELAYMVITHSQRDPGDYLAQLQGFATIENLCIKKAMIDKHLERFELAIAHLVDAGPEYFKDALELAQAHGLLRYLLSLVKDRETRKTVQRALGESLSNKGKYEDAALAFVAGEDLEQALRSYRLACAWRPAMTLAKRLNKDDVSIKDLATRMANDLEDALSFEEAAHVTLEYLGDIMRAVRLFALAGNWREALRVAVSQGSMQILDSVLAPVAATNAEKLLESFKDDRDRVEKYWRRLKDLREKRMAMDALKATADAESDLPLHMTELDAAYENDAASIITDLSMYTDASMATSAATGTSFASTIGGRKGIKSKNNDKKKKKKNRIRQGSPEEEAQLAHHILSLLPLPSVCTETGQLTEFLIFIGHEDDASVLQKALKALIDLQSEASADIISNPPPGKSLELPYSIREDIFNRAGLHALTIVEDSLLKQASSELQIQVKEAEASMKATNWKWELLRDP